MTIQEFITNPENWECTEVHINGVQTGLKIGSDDEGFFVWDGKGEKIRTFDQLEADGMEDITISIGWY